MAGSFNHICDENGNFTMEFIENLGEAHEALEECFDVILYLTNEDFDQIDQALIELGYPTVSDEF